MNRYVAILTSFVLLIGLTECGPKVTPEEFFAAINDGDTEKVKALLERGADVNARDSHGNTALINAVSGLRIEKSIVGLLLNAGADVNAKAGDGRTALIVAATFGHGDIVKDLLAKGVDVNAKNDQGVTALMKAAGNCAFNQFGIVDLLLNAEADIDAKASDGTTALLKAACCGASNMNIINALIARGADVNAAYNSGVTVLMCVAALGNLSLARLLIENGADVNKGVEGRTALWVARRQGHTKMAELLQEAQGRSSGAAKAVNNPKGSGAEARGMAQEKAVQDDPSTDGGAHSKATLAPDEFGRQLFTVLQNKDYDSIDRWLWHKEDWAHLAELGEAVPEEKQQELVDRIKKKLHAGITHYHESYFKIGTPGVYGEPIRTVEYVGFTPGRARQISPKYIQYNDSYLVIKINGLAEERLEIDHIQVISGVWHVSEIR